MIWISTVTRPGLLQSDVSPLRLGKLSLQASDVPLTLAKQIVRTRNVSKKRNLARPKRANSYIEVSVGHIARRWYKSRHSLSSPFTRERDCLLLILSENLYEWECLLQNPFEFAELELVYVKGIRTGWSPCLRVVVSVRSRDQKHAVRRQYPCRFLYQRIPVVKMLDDFECRNQVKGGICQRE